MPPPTEPPTTTALVVAPLESPAAESETGSSGINDADTDGSAVAEGDGVGKAERLVDAEDDTVASAVRVAEAENSVTVGIDEAVGLFVEEAVAVVVLFSVMSDVADLVGFAEAVDDVVSDAHADVEAVDV